MVSRWVAAVLCGAGVLAAAGCSSASPGGVVTVEASPPAPVGAFEALDPALVEGAGLSGEEPQVRVSADRRTLWFGHGKDLCDQLTEGVDVTASRVVVAQRLAPDPEAPAACVAGDAVPVVVVRLDRPLEGQVVRITTTRAAERSA